MNGGILRNLLKGFTSSSGDDIARSLVSKYGDDIARSVSSAYGDDVAASTLSKLTNTAPTNPIANELTKDISNFGSKSLKNRIKTAASSSADDAYIRKFGNALSKDTLKRGRTTSPRYTDKTYFKILEENGVNPNNISDFANVSKSVGKLRDSVIDQADSVGNNARSKEVLGIFQNAYDTTNFGKTAFRKTGKDYAQNYLKELSNSLDDAGNMPLGALRKTSTRLQSKAADLKSLADKGGANAEENLAMSDYLKKIQGGLDDYIDNITENSVVGADLQKQTVDILQKAGVHPNTLKEIAAMNPEEFKLSTMKSIMSPYVFAGSDIASDLATAKPNSGAALLGIPGTESIGGALKSGANNINYNVNRILAGEGGDSVKKAAKYAALGLGGVGVLSGLTSGNNSSVGSMNNMQASASLPSGNTTGVGGGTTSSSLASSDMTVAGYNRNQLENMYVAALNDNNGDAADYIGNLISMLDNKESAATKASSSSTSSNKLQSALSQLGVMLETYQPQGVVQGNITNVLNSITGGAYDPQTSAYNSQAQSVGISLIKALGETGALSESDMARAKALIPTNTDSPASAQQKISNLYSMLQAVNGG